MSATATSNVLITGGTSGIGLELARHYARCGHRVVAVGRRNPDELAEPLPHDCVYCQADLSKSNAAEIVLQTLRDSSIDCLDLLIHNAAVGFIGQPTDQLQNSICELLATNLMAPIELSHACLPLLSKGHFKTGSPALKTSSPRRGKIVFVSSVVSRFASPDFAVYAATKAALDGFARSLRIELRNAIDVQVIHPGGTRTGFHAKSGAATGFNVERFPAAEQVAEKMARAIKGRRRSATIGLGNSVFRAIHYHVGGIIEQFQRRGHKS